MWVGRGSEWELCGDVNYDGSSVFVIACNKYGDGVKITNDNSYLTLCEVEVLGKCVSFIRAIFQRNIFWRTRYTCMLEYILELKCILEYLSS